MKKTLAVLYCLYDHQFFTPYNLEHIYDYVDQIVIAYGPFKYYPQIKKKILGYDDDNTLSIIKYFMKNRDVDHKITLVIEKEWDNLLAKRMDVQRRIDTDWFFNIGPDEFFLDGHLEKVRHIINEYNDVINAIYNPKIQFCHDFRHYWGEDDISNNNDKKFRDRYGHMLAQCKKEKDILYTGGYSVLPFYNMPILWNIKDPRTTMMVCGYKNESGLYWVKNAWDTVLYHSDGTPFIDLNTTYYARDVIAHHYFTAQEPELHFLQRAVYYDKVRYPERDINELIKEKQMQHPNWREESIKMYFIDRDTPIYDKEPIIYTGEYPTVIKHHPSFFKVNI